MCVSCVLSLSPPPFPCSHFPYFCSSHSLFSCGRRGMKEWEVKNYFAVAAAATVAVPLVYNCTVNWVNSCSLAGMLSLVIVLMPSCLQ